MKLFDQVETVSRLPHGWATLEKGITLASIVLATRPKLIVEIGVWSGRSLLPMALAAREVGVGRVLGIDPYAAAASIEGQSPENAEWWGKQSDHDMIHDEFLKQVALFGLQDIVQLLRQRSDDVEPPANIGLLSLDGNHGVQVLKDVARYGPAIRPGGFLVLDDLHWKGGAVSEAADQLIRQGFEELFRVVNQELGNDWAVFQKVK